MTNLLVDFWKKINNERPEYVDIIQEVFAYVAHLSVTVPGHNEGREPKMPDDITMVPDKELGKLIDEQTQWGSYLSSQLAIADGTLNVLRNELEFIEANIRLAYKEDETGRKTTVQQRDDLVKVDARFLAYHRQVTKYDFVCKILKASVEAAHNNVFSISRQITQRGQDFDRQNRSFNIANIPKGMMGR